MKAKKSTKRLIVSEDNKPARRSTVGDTSDYGNLLQLVPNANELPENPDIQRDPAVARGQW